MGMLLLLFTFIAIATAAAISIYGAATRHFPLARRAMMAGAAVAAGYGGLLIGSGVSAGRRNLEVGEELRFCGFYFDCHLSAAVERVETTKRLGAPPYEATAGGLFHVVTVRLASNARRASLGLTAPTAHVMDARGGRHDPSPLGDSALASMGRERIPLNVPLTNGSRFTTTLVFDLPEHRGPYFLHLREGRAPQRFIERILIGDDDAVLRRHPGFTLTASR